MGLVVLNASGAEVSGGGNGAPFVSPLTLRFSGGSSGMALPFLPPSFPSFPPTAVPLRASSSSNECS